MTTRPRWCEPRLVQTRTLTRATLGNLSLEVANGRNLTTSSSLPGPPSGGVGCAFGCPPGYPAARKLDLYTVTTSIGLVTRTRDELGTDPLT